MIWNGESISSRWNIFFERDIKMEYNNKIHLTYFINNGGCTPHKNCL
jgi:hypothetical protein